MSATVSADASPDAAANFFVKCDSGKNILFALYHKDGVMDTTYHDLICENFETFLNIDES